MGGKYDYPSERAYKLIILTSVLVIGTTLILLHLYRLSKINLNLMILIPFIILIVGMVIILKVDSIDKDKMKEEDKMLESGENTLNERLKQSFNNVIEQNLTDNKTANYTNIVLKYNGNVSANSNVNFTITFKTLTNGTIVNTVNLTTNETGSKIIKKRI